MNGEAEYAVELMTATHDRSWWNMLEVGSTMTLEAWDLKYKNNLDWNHAWGAAPANIIPRWVLGVRPLEPGFTKVIIQPQSAPLTEVKGKVPTPLGPVYVEVINNSGGPCNVEVDTPEGMEVEIVQPQSKSASPPMSVRR